MIIYVTSSAQTKKSDKPAKRSTPSIFQKKNNKVKGYVDRVSNGIVVVVIRNPEDKDCVKEIFIPVSKFPKGVPEEGDYICVTIER